MSDASYIGAKIKEMRQARGWTQQYLGEKFSVPKDSTVISRWERGRVAPSLRHIQELAGILQISIEAFLCPLLGQTCQAVEQAGPAGAWACEAKAVNK